MTKEKDNNRLLSELLAKLMKEHGVLGILHLHLDLGDSSIRFSATLLDVEFSVLDYNYAPPFLKEDKYSVHSLKAGQSDMVFNFTSMAEAVAYAEKLCQIPNNLGE